MNPILNEKELKHDLEVLISEGVFESSDVFNQNPAVMEITKMAG